MKWFWWALWHPLAAFDLIDPRGKPDHGKVMGWIGFWTFIVLILIDKLPSLGHTIALLAAVYGSRVFVAFLRSRAVTAHEERTVSQVTVRRDTDRGMEAS